MSGKKESERRLELHRQGLTDGEIAERVNRKRQTIMKWRARLGLPVNRARRRSAGSIYLRPEEEAKRKRLYDEGLSDIEIANKTGVSRTAIRSWRSRRSIPANLGKGSRSSLKEGELERIEALNEKGLTDQEIADEIRRSYSFVRYQRAEKLGLPPIYERGPSKHLSSTKMAIINLYHTNPEWDWAELANASDYIPQGYSLKDSITKVKIIVGQHLMRVCRSQEEACALSPLLPENVYEEEGRQN